jgi:hypothetical protein
MMNVFNNFDVDAQRGDYWKFRKASEIKKNRGKIKSFEDDFVRSIIDWKYAPYMIICKIG